MIALLGLDAETGVFMLLFLDLSYEQSAGSAAARADRAGSTRPSCTAR